jgi:hypothetical protein
MGLIYKSYLVTLNQRVQGSSPCAPTSPIKGLGPNWVLAGKTGAPFRAPAQPASRGSGFALPATPATTGVSAATLRVKFWPEPFEKERQRPQRRRTSTPPGPVRNNNGLRIEGTVGPVACPRMSAKGACRKYRFQCDEARQWPYENYHFK